MTNVYDHARMQAQAGELTAAVLEILDLHVGSERAIKARDLARLLGLRSDRAMREAIRQLRREGYLIVSSVGANPGYFVAASREEWEAFRDGNLKPRAFDILETAKAMSDAAQRRFGSTAGLDLRKARQLGMEL